MAAILDWCRGGRGVFPGDGLSDAPQESSEEQKRCGRTQGDDDERYVRHDGKSLLDRFQAMSWAVLRLAASKRTGRMSAPRTTTSPLIARIDSVPISSQ